MSDSRTPGSGPPPSLALDDTIDARDASAARVLPVGVTLGRRYVVERFLGQGGMGAVYLALDEALEKRVALKVVTEDVTGSSDAIRRLRDEVLLAQEVTHANVCRTYDLEEVDGRSLIKMEYVAGETLAHHLAEGPLGVDEALRIARQIAEGLGAAHQKGVVHRDLKPQNVMIEEGSGRVVLMDFGVARPATGAGRAADGIAGTPEYMSPEQALAREVDGRSDLYSLGCVLYRMLVGQVVFPAATPMEAALRHAEDTPSDPRATRPEIPAWLAGAILRMLAKDPGRRPPDSSAVLALLENPRRRWPRLAATAAVVAALAAGVGAIAVRPWRAPPTWRPDIRPLPAYEENAEMTLISPDGRLIAYSSDREQAGFWRSYVEPLDGSGRPRAITPPEMVRTYVVGWERDGRSLLVTDLGARPASYRVPLDGPPEWLVDRAFVFPCGERWLLQYGYSPSCSLCQRLALRDQAGVERDVKGFPPDEFTERPACDPAGERIVFVKLKRGHANMDRQPSDLWLIPTAGGEERRLTFDGLHNRFPRFAPDGRSVIFSSTRGGKSNLWELPLDGGKPAQLTFGEGPDIGPFPSPDGERLVFNVDLTAGQVFARPSEGGARRRVTSRIEALNHLRVAPDGREVLAVATDPIRGGAGRIVAVSVADGDVRTITTGDMAAFTPDGREIVLVVQGTPARLQVVPREGGTPRRIAEVEGTVSGLLVGPDGQAHFTLMGERVEAWRAPVGGGVAVREADPPWCRILPAPVGGWRAVEVCGSKRREFRLVPPGLAIDDPAVRVVEAVELAWDAGGDSVITSDQHTIKRIQVASGAETQLAEVPGCWNLDVSPDGQTLYTIENVARVTRHVMMNFADRPRP